MGHAEQPVKAACVELLELRGWYVVNHVVGHFKTLWGKRVSIGKPGESDLLAFSSKGVPVWVETKRPKGGRISQEQRDFQAEMRKRGVPCLFISDVRQLAAWLDGKADALA